MEENHQLALGRTDKQRVLNGLKQLLEVREVMLCWRAGHQNVTQIRRLRVQTPSGPPAAEARVS